MAIDLPEVSEELFQESVDTVKELMEKEGMDKEKAIAHVTDHISNTLHAWLMEWA